MAHDNIEINKLELIDSINPKNDTINKITHALFETWGFFLYIGKSKSLFSNLNQSIFVIFHHLFILIKVLFKLSAHE